MSTEKTYCIWTTCKKFEPPKPLGCSHLDYICVKERMTKAQFQAKYPEAKFCEDYEEEKSSPARPAKPKQIEVQLGDNAWISNTADDIEEDMWLLGFRDKKEKK